MPKSGDFLSGLISEPDGVYATESYAFQRADLNALRAAYMAGRPLLLKGEPGTGKTQMASAIAQHLGYALVSEVFNYHTELNDLFFHFDAVVRLADAQVNARPKPNNDPVDLSPSNYLSPGPLWWAFDWSSAIRRYPKVAAHHRPKPHEPKPDAYKQGVVLLLDEIDKAQPELANGLLEALGQFEFTVPYLSQPIRAGEQKPLIIITSNDERELPKALVRRCFVHTLTMEDSTDLSDMTLTIETGEGQVETQRAEKRYAWLIERGRVHFSDQLSDEIYLEVAKLLWEDREKVYGDGYKPGLAEYIDLLTVLSQLDKDERLSTLNDIAQFVLRKSI